MISNNFSVESWKIHEDKFKEFENLVAVKIPINYKSYFFFNHGTIPVSEFYLPLKKIENDSNSIIEPFEDYMVLVQFVINNENKFQIFEFFIGIDNNLKFIYDEDYGIFKEFMIREKVMFIGHSYDDIYWVLGVGGHNYNKVFYVELFNDVVCNVTDTLEDFLNSIFIGIKR
jgi:hypothetical protein